MSLNNHILCGDARDMLSSLPARSVQCCVTSPPYWGLRDYGVEGQIGLEDSPSAYIAALMPVFDQIWRVLRDDGTLWLNLGDTYIGYHGNKKAHGAAPSDKPGYREGMRSTSVGADGLKNKDLAGIPWRVAFALQDAGWYLRCDCIWAKPNPMPESVKDRPTRAHEYIFLLAKADKYSFDASVIREPAKSLPGGINRNQVREMNCTPAYQANRGGRRQEPVKRGAMGTPDDGFRNKRSVWTVSTRPFPDAHFATFPPDLIRPCILAGCPAGGTVLDPFFGSGTVGQVYIEERRSFIGIEINPEYVAMAERRIAEARRRGPRQASFRDVVEAMA